MSKTKIRRLKPKMFKKVEFYRVQSQCISKSIHINDHFNMQEDKLFICDAGKDFNNIQYLFMIKLLTIQEQNFLDLLKGIYKEATKNIPISEKDLKYTF